MLCINPAHHAPPIVVQETGFLADLLLTVHTVAQHHIQVDFFDGTFIVQKQRHGNFYKVPLDLLRWRLRLTIGLGDKLAYLPLMSDEISPIGECLAAVLTFGAEFGCSPQHRLPINFLGLDLFLYWRGYWFHHGITARKDGWKSPVYWRWHFYPSHLTHLAIGSTTVAQVAGYAGATTERHVTVHTPRPRLVSTLRGYAFAVPVFVGFFHLFLAIFATLLGRVYD